MEAETYYALFLNRIISKFPLRHFLLFGADKIKFNFIVPFFCFFFSKYYILFPFYVRLDALTRSNSVKESNARSVLRQWQTLSRSRSLKEGHSVPISPTSPCIMSSSPSSQSKYWVPITANSVTTRDFLHIKFTKSLKRKTFYFVHFCEMIKHVLRAYSHQSKVGAKGEKKSKNNQNRSKNKWKTPKTIVSNIWRTLFWMF